MNALLPVCCLTLAFVVASFSASSANGHRQSISPNADRGCVEAKDDDEGGMVDEEEAKERPSSARLSSDEDQVEKRKWGDMRAWGKREGAEKRDWNRSSLKAWGKKREDEEREVDKKTGGRSESRLGFEGKGDDGGEEEKRDQTEESEEGGGKKRGWEKSGPLRAWGKKRLDDGSSEELESPSRRDWNSRVRAWGRKRDDEEDEGDSKEETAAAAERAKRAIEGSLRRLSRPKRSWGGGSRDGVDAADAFLGHIGFYPPEGPKRSWRTNVIRVWGKRTSR